MAREIFDFDLDKEAILQLIDYKEPGEVFQLFDQGRSLGKTAPPNNTMNEDESVIYADSPDLAMVDQQGRFSKGQVLLKPGHHSISIKILTGSSTTPHLAGGGIRLVPSIRLQQFHRTFEEENDDYYYVNDQDSVAVTTITVVVPPPVQAVVRTFPVIQELE
ncbi:hypothetical protein BC941DRAFT_449500 [Chlamydoabsidia padenii]|nr:hypothetical protein BC941DRAFT_449500 [Chlamydoabsidia padenii]